MKPFSLLLLHYRAETESPNAVFNWEWGQFRCATGHRTLKNYSFDFMLQRTLKDRVIVQYRHPFYSSKSWHELERDKGRQLNPRSEFVRGKLDDWESLVNKWMLGYGLVINILLVLYGPSAEKELIVRDSEFIGLENYVVNLLGGNYFKGSRKIPEGLRIVAGHV